jgi:hypothetical protein
MISERRCYTLLLYTHPSRVLVAEDSMGANMHDVTKIGKIPNLFTNISGKKLFLVTGYL